MDENSILHTKWKCQYHIVFIPKYRKEILYFPFLMLLITKSQKHPLYKAVKIQENKQISNKIPRKQLKTAEIPRDFVIFFLRIGGECCIIV